MASKASTPAWLVDFTSNAAETFITAYYVAADSPQRAQVRQGPRTDSPQLLPSLYLPTSTISWNGNPISGSAQYAQLVDAQPGSKHEIQSFDCHALSTPAQGTSTAHAMSSARSAWGGQRLYHCTPARATAAGVASAAALTRTRGARGSVAE